MRGCRFFALLFLLFFIFIPAARICAAPALDVKAKSIPIKKIEVQGLYTLDKGQLIYLLCLNSAKVIVPENLARGIKRAFKKGIFEYISVSEDEKRPGVIIVRVRERDRIKDVSFEFLSKGGPSKSFLADRFLLRQGDFMRYDLVDRAASALKASLSRAGYPDAAVDVDVRRTPEKKDPYFVKLHVSVLPGAPLLVKEVRIIKGAAGGPPGKEPGKDIKLKPGDVYDQFKLESQLAWLKDDYLKRHYVNPQVGPYAFVNGALSTRS